MLFPFLFLDSMFSSLLFFILLIVHVYCLFFVSSYRMFFHAMFPVVFIPLKLVLIRFPKAVKTINLSKKKYLRSRMEYQKKINN